MQPHGNVEASVKDFILSAFLQGNDGSELTDTTDLVAGGIVDSINVLRLVEFMEEEFNIMIEHGELKKLTSVANIAQVIRSKLAA